MKNNIYILLFLVNYFVYGQSDFQKQFDIKGQVIFNGEVAVGLSVLLKPNNIEVSTNAEGIYKFTNLKSGKYTVNIKINGLTEQKEIYLTKSETIDFYLEDESEVLNVVNINVEKERTDDFVKSEYSAMPVVIIDKKTIELMGSRRLDEVLKEQTGMAIVNNIGGGTRSIGVQMQGFGSEYIMVLIDGQPLVGRNNGDLDLSRISVSSIERIEIIKGASSSLYGSEALGGTINIITKAGAVDPQLLASVNYGTFNIVDATIEGETPIAKNRGSIYAGVNYYRTDGFNTNQKFIKGTTSPPYDNYAFQIRGKYKISKKLILGANVRYGLRKSLMQKDFGIGTISDDTQDEQDLNTALTLEYKANNCFKTLTRYYYTYYNTDMSIALQNNDTQLMQEVFIQDLHKIDQQFSYKSGSIFQFVGGIGGSVEDMKDQQMLDIEKQNSFFTYLQGEWLPTENLKVVGGLRYDYTNRYNGRVNPSLGFQYKIIPSLTFKTGVGTGFKAPDFKKNYLVFFNPTANYLIVGNAVLNETIKEMQKQGQISEVREYVVNQAANNLKAEKSTSLHAGFDWKPSAKFQLENSWFYHHIENQINTIQAATGMNNQIIYTYQNLPKAVNKGFDVSVKYTPAENLSISLGYQYLVSKDLSVLDSINAGKWPYNQNIHDPTTGKSYPATKKDYWGIENRSRHMANLNLFYKYKPWDISATIRANYRGKYPFGDRNGNYFIDKYDTFVDGHFLLNASLEKKLLHKQLSLRITADNLLDYTDPLMPGQPGRIILVGVSYRLFKE